MVDHYSHRCCTFILPDASKPERLWKNSPRWARERTHGCWCASWRMTRNGLRIWKRGAWRKPKPGEVRRVRGYALARLKLLGHA